MNDSDFIARIPMISSSSPSGQCFSISLPEIISYEINEISWNYSTSQWVHNIIKTFPLCTSDERY